MKIRNGFVSNSSSSSFVVGKAYMTPEQISKFGTFIARQEDGRYDDEEDEDEVFHEETCLYEEDYYFQGRLDNCDYDKVVSFLKEIGVDQKYVSITC